MNKDVFILKKDGWILLCLLVVHVACWFAMKPLLPESDPLCYFLNAKKILNHEYVLTNSVQDHRFGVFVPQAFLIALFGESPYVINLWPLLCSLMTISLVYCATLTGINRLAAFVAALLLSVNLIQIIYSSVVFPDMIVSFFSLLCVYFLFKGRKENIGKFKNSLLFILFFALGFISKESIALLIPFLGFVLLIDLKHKRQTRFFKKVSLLLALFGVCLFSISKLLTNDFFFFLNSFKNYELFMPLPDFAAFLKRISYEPLLFLNSQLGYVFIFLFSIPSFISGMNKKDNYYSIESFFSLYFIVLLLALWWGSFSIIHFGFVPITDRRWMMLIAPLCILSAITIQKIVANTLSKNTVYSLILVLSGLGIVNACAFSFQRGALFLSFAFILWSVNMMHKHSRFSYILKTILLLLPFGILAVYFLLANSNYVIAPPA